MSRVLWALVLASIVATGPSSSGCGGSTASSASATRSSTPLVLAARAPFRVTLPDGVVLEMDADGRVTRDGASHGALQADGRYESSDGESIAALIPDGQLAHRGRAHPARILSPMPSALGATGATLREGAVDLVTLEGERLMIAEGLGMPPGEVPVSFEAQPVRDDARVAVVFVVAVHLLERGRERAEARVDERPAPRGPGTPPPVPADVAAAPAHAPRTASGLASIVLRPGTGSEHPTAQSRVEVHYSGWSTDGRLFDSSVVRGEPAVFPLSGVIPGWTEGLQLMVEGEQRRFWMPAALAYGDRPRRGMPTGMLVFDIELIRIVR